MEYGNAVTGGGGGGGVEESTEGVQFTVTIVSSNLNFSLCKAKIMIIIIITCQSVPDHIIFPCSFQQFLYSDVLIEKLVYQIHVLATFVSTSA